MSKFQKKCKVLTQKVLGNITIKEEVNVKSLFPEYEAHNQHYDLVIPQYNLIIECHGEQHRSMKSFGTEKDDSNPMAKFILQKRRDRRKEQIALDNEWSYVIIWYSDISNDEEKSEQKVSELITQAFEENDDD